MRRMLNTLYVTNADAYLRKQDDCVAVFVDDKKAMSIPFHLLEGIVLFGHVGCSTSLLGSCASHGVCVTILDERGRFMARVEGPVSGNVLLRREQYKRAADEDASFFWQRDSWRQSYTIKELCSSATPATTLRFAHQAWKIR